MAKHSQTKTASLQELAVSSMLSIEAMLRVLVKKGVLTEKEVVEDRRELAQLDHEPFQDRAPSRRTGSERPEGRGAVDHEREEAVKAWTHLHVRPNLRQ